MKITTGCASEIGITRSSDGTGQEKRVVFVSDWEKKPTRRLDLKKKKKRKERGKMSIKISRHTVCHIGKFFLF